LFCLFCLLFQKLFRLNFRVQKNTRTTKGSDFAEVAYYVLKNRCNEDVTMSIWEINKILDEIAVENGKGKEGQKVCFFSN
jgi:hypothetical protein